MDALTDSRHNSIEPGSSGLLDAGDTSQSGLQHPSGIMVQMTFVVRLTLVCVVFIYRNNGEHPCGINGRSQCRSRNAK